MAPCSLAIIGGGGGGGGSIIVIIVIVIRRDRRGGIGGGLEILAGWHCKILAVLGCQLPQLQSTLLKVRFLGEPIRLCADEDHRDGTL